MKKSYPSPRLLVLYYRLRNWIARYEWYIALGFILLVSVGAALLVTTQIRTRSTVRFYGSLETIGICPVTHGPGNQAIGVKNDYPVVIGSNGMWYTAVPQSGGVLQTKHWYTAIVVQEGKPLAPIIVSVTATMAPRGQSGPAYWRTHCPVLPSDVGGVVIP
jgi:hypothetical protein